MVKTIRDGMNRFRSLQEALHRVTDWPPRIIEELYHLKNRTDKDIVTALFLSSELATAGIDPASRISPALFFQPHFPNIVYRLRASQSGNTILEADNYEKVHQSPVFKNFKYIKTFTPMRRFTTSHGASVKFMYARASEKETNDEGKTTVVSDAVMQRVLNRSFMIDPEDRLYKDGVVVRFEDGKLNPVATFTALAAFLDLPYTESMTYCSENGVRDIDHAGNVIGFDPATVYRTYDEFVNDSERKYIEYFLRDAYAYYGYDFKYYDGGPVDIAQVAEWISGFDTIDSYMRKTWIKVFRGVKAYRNGEQIVLKEEDEIQEKLLEDHIRKYAVNRMENAKVLMEGLRFVNKSGQPLHMMPKLELDQALLEQPLYH